MNTLENNQYDDNKENSPIAPQQESAKDILEGDDLHEVEVNDDLNEPDAENVKSFDKDNTSHPDDVQGEGTQLDSMDDGIIDTPGGDDED